MTGEIWKSTGNILAVGMSLIFILPAPLAKAKCRGFEAGSPNFCATVKILDKEGTEGDSCIYSGEIVGYEKTEPLKQPYPFYEEKFTKEKKYVFRLARDFCKDDMSAKTVRAVIVAQCNDNLLMGREFLAKIGILAPLSNFNLSDKPSVQIYKNGSFTKVEASCPAASSQ